MVAATLRAMLAGVAALLAFGASAQQWTTRDGVQYSQTTAQRVLAAHRADQAWAERLVLERQINGIPGNAGSVSVVDKVKGPSPKVGDIIDIEMKRTLPWSKITKAMAKSLPLISTAVALKEIMDAIRCREAPGATGECDPGTVETTQTATVYCFSSGALNQQCFPSVAAAAAAQAAVFNTGAVSSCSWNGPKPYTVVYSVLATRTSPGPGFKLQWNTVNSQCSSIMDQDANWRDLFTDQRQVTQCPTITVNGVQLVPVKGPDGKCATNVYQPASEEAIATKGETYGDKTKAPQVVGELGAAGKPIEHDPPIHDPVPSSVVGPRETTTHPDGSTTIRDTVWDLAPTPDGYGWTPRTTTKDYPPGATIPPPGTVSDGTTTTGSAPKEDPITCGLPNTPPCKIDESGTPRPSDPFEQNPGSWFDPIRGLFENPDVPDTSWSFSFSLPTVCSVLTAGPFAGRTVSIDLCQYQPMIHDIMSLVWLMAGVWIAIGMVGRTIGST